jgi:hypothetical protein
MRRAFPLSSLIHHSNPAERFELPANDRPAVSVQLNPVIFSSSLDSSNFATRKTFSHRTLNFGNFPQS